jgi:hypothetical protein
MNLQALEATARTIVEKMLKLARSRSLVQSGHGVAPSG